LKNPSEQPPTLRKRLEEIAVGVVVGIVVLVAGGALALWLFGSNRSEPSANGASPHEEAAFHHPPPALEAADRAVPDAKGPVHERVWAEEGARTFKNPYALSGEGLRVPYNKVVMVECKIYWPELRSVKHSGYWYRLLTPPWRPRYSPANSFWNGQKPGEPPSHPVDWRVRTCKPTD
jgi:hypothetical protein